MPNNKSQKKNPGSRNKTHPKQSLENNMVETNITQELLTWYDTITKQNYFSFKEHTHIQTEGLVMGAHIVQHPLRNFPTS
jgi:hypothetical protein